MQISIGSNLKKTVVNEMRNDSVYGNLIQSFDALEMAESELNTYMIAAGLSSTGTPRKVSKYQNALKAAKEAAEELKTVEVNKVIAGSL
jgi:hypothetical protein